LILHSRVYQDWEFAAAAGVERMFVVPNAADPPAAEPTSRSERTGESLAITVGSHVVSKGHAEFARAVRALGRERAIAGTIVAPTRHGLDALRGCQMTCRARARRQSLRLVDGSAPGAVESAIAGADLFLFTSRVECAPLVILEAMAAGKPWVSYDVGNVSELAGGVVVAGFEELVGAARRILDGSLAHLGAEGRAAWEASHRWEDVVPRYESIFSEVLEGCSAPAA
jgi:glycosyltransferase involved in cell wall biosynthesis